MNAAPFDVLTALMYIDTHPGVHTRTFVRQHRPLGNMLWAELFYTDYIRLDTVGGLYLTDLGMNLLTHTKEAL